MKYSPIKTYIKVILLAKNFGYWLLMHNTDSSTEVNYSCIVDKNVDDRKRQYLYHSQLLLNTFEMNTR